ncbi:expressed unknown protein [Seminavis robusta]|uniref:Uncharacterized protein n=1 Tax=Seminavis robusta TaxID=568900 RepID=A0A9N8DNV1_9STRA|nr:expressed unknown protein [Seminavis robusta]|eukprot:Sro187_g080820.1 n/a (243) ;mRNA; f:9779-10598
MYLYAPIGKHHAHLIQPPSTFREYLLSTPDPNQDHIQAMDAAFRPPIPGAAGPTPAQCFAIPGRSDNNINHCAFVGDLDEHGTMPPIVVIAQNAFDPLDNLATLQNVWNVLPLGATGVQPPAANADKVNAKCLTPIPYPYVNQILQAHMDGLLTWRYLITEVLQSVSLVAVEEEAYSGFVDWVRVSSTERPDPTNPGNFIDPETVMEFVAVLGVPRALNTRRPIVLLYLAGLELPTVLERHI